MKLCMSFLSLILFLSGNINADVKYYESTDPFTDEEIYYVYGESVNNEFLTPPAYFKIAYLEERDEMLLVFNSEYFNYSSDRNRTVEMQYRFDKEKAASLDLYFCSAFDEAIEYCRLKKSERNPSLGYFAREYDNDSHFVDDMFIWGDEDSKTPPLERKKLLILFPGEEPIEFNLKGSFNAFSKLIDKIMSSEVFSGEEN